MVPRLCEERVGRASGVLGGASIGIGEIRKRLEPARIGRRWAVYRAFADITADGAGTWVRGWVCCGLKGRGREFGLRCCDYGAAGRAGQRGCGQRRPRFGARLGAVQKGIGAGRYGCLDGQAKLLSVKVMPPKVRFVRQASGGDIVQRMKTVGQVALPSIRVAISAKLRLRPGVFRMRVSSARTMAWLSAP